MLNNENKDLTNTDQYKLLEKLAKNWQTDSIASGYTYHLIQLSDLEQSLWLLIECKTEGFRCLLLNKWPNKERLDNIIKKALDDDYSLGKLYKYEALETFLLDQSPEYQKIHAQALSKKLSEYEKQQLF